MVTIRTSGYSQKDKLIIAKNYMLPKMLASFNFDASDITFTDEVLRHIISTVEEEAGVRNLKRGMEDIISHINLQRLLKKPIVDDIPVTLPLDVTKQIVDKYLSKPKKKEEWAMSAMYL